ncbi:MAG: hypothetical protein WC686_05855 [Candidatus Shapirobacteria bacterium]
MKKKETWWKIKIPPGAAVLVRSGQKVVEGEVILTVQQKEVKVYDASLVLSRYSKERMAQLITSLVGREVEEGEQILAEGGLFPKKIFSPCKGIVSGIDELGNIRFDVNVLDVREIRAPVPAKVLKIEKGIISLGFLAYEFEGKGIVDGKVWGNYGGKISRLAEVNFCLKNCVIFVEKLTYVLVTKAEVVGVVGIVTSGAGEDQLKDRLDAEIPILSVENTDWEKLGDLKPDRSDRILINSRKGKLVVVPA